MFTVQEYDAITACVPLPTKIECSSISDPLGLRGSKIEDIEMVWTAICVRMMLQRKYFSNSERVQLKKLLISPKLTRASVRRLLEICVKGSSNHSEEI